jgi:hypothetical protein
MITPLTESASSSHDDPSAQKLVDDLKQSVSRIPKHLLESNKLPSKQEEQDIREMMSPAQMRIAQLAETTKEVQRKIEELQKLIDASVKETKELKNHMQAHNSIISPMRRIPYDILREVFLYALGHHLDRPGSFPLEKTALGLEPWEKNETSNAEEAEEKAHIPVGHDLNSPIEFTPGHGRSGGPLQLADFNTSHGPWLLGRVCSNWRSVIISLPMAWSKICVMCPRDGQIKQHHPDLLKTILERSQSCPLDIAIRAPSINTARPLIKMLVAVSDRWRELSFGCAPGPAWTRLFSKMKLSRLESLHFSEAFDYLSRPQSEKYTALVSFLDCFKSAKNLCRVSFDAMLFPHDGSLALDSLPIPWSNLTHCAPPSGIGKDGEFRLLSKLPNLVEYRFLDDYREDVNIANVTLNQLRRLAIPKVRGKALDWLTLPALEEIDLYDTEKTLVSLSNMISRSSCSIKSLTLRHSPQRPNKDHSADDSSESGTDIESSYDTESDDSDDESGPPNLVSTANNITTDSPRAFGSIKKLLASLPSLIDLKLLDYHPSAQATIFDMLNDRMVHTNIDNDSATTIAFKVLPNLHSLEMTFRSNKKDTYDSNALSALRTLAEARWKSGSGFGSDPEHCFNRLRYLYIHSTKSQSPDAMMEREVSGASQYFTAMQNAGMDISVRVVRKVVVHMSYRW